MSDLIERLQRAGKRMADLTADRRAPMISIPPSSDDDDMLICGACKDAADEIERLREEIYRLSACHWPDSQNIGVVTIGNERWATACKVAEEFKRLRLELAEAESALWRVAPNTYTLAPGIPDPFEGPGETYAATYDRLRRELAQVHDLLAVIHRDGGHYREQHGLSVALTDAIDVVTDDRRNLAEARGLLQEVQNDGWGKDLDSRIVVFLAAVQPSPR